MKFTAYFRAMRERPDRRIVPIEWIERTVREPDHRAVQRDGRIRLWKAIPEADGRWLRVVLLDDGETVHNAFLDRGFQQ